MCKPFWNLHEKQTRTALPTKSVEIILTARQNMKISAITDETETFCNCNGVSTDTKQTTTPNAVEKVNISKKLHSFVCANLFLNLHEKQTRTALPTKSVVFFDSKTKHENICNYRLHGNFWQLKRRFDRHKTDNDTKRC